MKVSSTAETRIQTKDSSFDIENGVLKKYHWQKCEETENEKAVSDEDDELMRILSGTGEDSEIPEADNAKAEVQPDDEVKEEKKPKKQGFLAKLSKLLFGDDEPDEEEISGMQAEPAVTEMSMDDMDILKELEGSSDDDKKGKKETSDVRKILNL